MLAREKQPAARLCEPAAQRGIECRIEYGVPAARPRSAFPAKLAPPGDRDVGGTEPVQRAGEPGNAFSRNQISRGIARRSTGQQRQDSRSTSLLLVAVPHGANRERRTERTR